MCVQPDRSYIVQIGGQELSAWNYLGEMVGLFWDNRDCSAFRSKFMSAQSYFFAKKP